MPNTHETLTSLFSAIADAIRVKTGGTDDIVADSFPTAINNIQTPLTESITITQNGTYSPPQGYHGFDEVEVDVQGIPLRKESGTLTVISDTNTVTVSCTANPLFFRLFPTAETEEVIVATPGVSFISLYGSSFAIKLTDDIKRCQCELLANGSTQIASACTAAYAGGFSVSKLASSGTPLRAGTYQWEAYYEIL